MRMNGGIMTVALEGFAQSGFRFAELVLLVINPAHAIEISAVVGFFLERALYQVGGFVQALPQITKHVAVVIEDGAVFGICRYGFLEFILSAVEEFLTLVNGAEDEPNHFVVAGTAGQDFSGVRSLFGFFEALGTFIDLRDIQIGVAVRIGFG